MQYGRFIIKTDWTSVKTFQPHKNSGLAGIKFKLKRLPDRKRNFRWNR